jgi:hypothetical protein
MAVLGFDFGGVGVFEVSEEVESLEFEDCSVEAVLYSSFVHQEAVEDSLV